MIEVHPDPDRALSDPEQQLDLPAFERLMADLIPVHEHVRGLHGDPLAVAAPIEPPAGTLSRH
jgi:hypothetical protein